MTVSGILAVSGGANDLVDLKTVHRTRDHENAPVGKEHVIYLGRNPDMPELRRPNLVSYRDCFPAMVGIVRAFQRIS